MSNIAKRAQHEAEALSYDMSLADLVGAVSETLACLAELAAKVEAEPRCDVPVCPVTVGKVPPHILELAQAACVAYYAGIGFSPGFADAIVAWRAAMQEAGL